MPQAIEWSFATPMTRPRLPVIRPWTRDPGAADGLVSLVFMAALFLRARAANDNSTSFMVPIPVAITRPLTKARLPRKDRYRRASSGHRRIDPLSDPAAGRA